MRKMTSTMETVAHLILQSLALMTTMINSLQPTFVTHSNQHQNVRNNHNVEQEKIDGFLERVFSTQN